MFSRGLLSGNTVQLAEFCCGCAPHITIQDRRLGFPQVYNDQSVERVRETAVQAEPEQAAADFGILPQQDREAFPVRLHVSDRLRKIIEIAEGAAPGAAVPWPQHCRAKG